jgi:hypothetical protein
MRSTLDFDISLVGRRSSVRTLLVHDAVRDHDVEARVRERQLLCLALAATRVPSWSTFSHRQETSGLLPTGLTLSQLAGPRRNEPARGDQSSERASCHLRNQSRRGGGDGLASSSGGLWRNDFVCERMSLSRFHPPTNNQMTPMARIAKKASATRPAPAIESSLRTITMPSPKQARMTMRDNPAARRIIAVYLRRSRRRALGT